MKIADFVKKIVRTVIPQHVRNSIHVSKYHLIFSAKRLNNYLINKKDRERKNQRITRSLEAIIRKHKFYPKNSAYIFQLQFFDKSGKECFNGGAERYCTDLSKVLSSLKMQTILFQCGTPDGEIWMKNFGELIIIGVPSSIEDFFDVISMLSSPRIAIYSGYHYWGGKKKKHHPSLLVSHGVTWDAPGTDTNNLTLKKNLYDFDSLVSVDTNTISYLRSAFPSSLGTQMYYLPNYVDNQSFHSNPQLLGRSRIKITYPRRLCKERGYWLFAPLLPKILDKYKHVDIEFVGFIHDEDIKRHLSSLISQYPKRIKHHLIEQDQMDKVYKSSNIVVIPTLYSEGTSLSCLEAMSSGNAVIATNIGGLPNLIINKFNGLLINPHTNDLFEALCLLVEKNELRKELGRNAEMVSKKFSKDDWENNWKTIIQNHF